MNESDAIRRMTEVLRLQHKALATESCYLHWLRHFMLKVKQMPPSLSSEQKLERFLTELAVSRDLAASTQNQAFNAIAFFYKDVLGKPLQNVESRRAVRPLHLRHAPTVSQTRALLQAVPEVAGYRALLPIHREFRRLVGRRKKINVNQIIVGHRVFGPPFECPLVL